MGMEHPMDVLGLGPEKHRETIPTFDSICHDLIENVSELEACIEDILKWKDDFTSQNIPPTVKLQVTLLFSKLFRCKSDLHGPIFEIVRQVMVYARSWNVNRESLLELEKEYHRQYYILDVAIRKLESMQNRMNAIKAQHQLSLWERLTTRILYHHNKDNKDEEEIVETVKPVQVEKTRAMSKPVLAKKPEKVSTEWEKLKETIANYCIDEPDWKREVRKKLNAFKTALRKHYAGVSGLVQELIQRPIPRTTAKLEYLSQKSGTLRFNMKPFPRARSLSLPDLKLFHRRDSTVREYQEWLKVQEQAQELDMYGVPLHKDEPLPPNPLIKRVRCNSTSCIYDFGPSVLLAGTFDETNEINNGRVADDQISDGESEVESSYTEQDGRAFKALLGSSSLKENIAAFLNEPIEQSPLQESNLEDLEKETFSLQDVMELTLLHAQQLHVMKQDFEKQESERQSTIERTASVKDLEIQRLSEQIAMLKKENESLVKRCETLVPAQSFEMKVDAPVEEREKSPLPIQKEITTPQKVVKELTPPSAPKTKSLGKLKQSKQDLNNKSYVQNHKRAPFSSTPFKLGFFERLEFFTESSQKYHQAQREAALQQERLENERKLAHLNLIRDKYDEEVPQVIPAEFMPMPGNVPQGKHKDVITLADHGIYTLTRYSRTMGRKV
jgi:hypothetical protein